MDLQERFELAVEKSNSAKGKDYNISNENLLELYSLFKQSTIGDNNTDKPSFVYIEKRAKWDAWSSKEGLNDKTSMKLYIKLVETLF